MPKKGKQARVLSKKAQGAIRTRFPAREEPEMTKVTEVTAGGNRVTEAPTAGPSQSHAQPASTSQPPPTTPTSQPPPTTRLSSAKKRKKLFGDEAVTGAVPEYFTLLVTTSDIETMMNKAVCGECYCTPVCTFKTYGTGTDCETRVMCSCAGGYYTMNSEIFRLRRGKLKFFSVTMKLVYTAMLEGMSYLGVQKSCAFLDMNAVNKRQFIKYKKEVARVATEKTRKHLDDSAVKVIRHYEEELDRTVDEDGLLDIDVTYDGKLHLYLFFFIFTLLLKRIYYKKSVTFW